MKRRDFLKGSLGAIASLPLLSMATIDSLFAGENQNDYKAIVVLKLVGGNDWFNTFIPIDNRYDDYKSARNTIAINNNDLSSSANFSEDSYYSSNGSNPYDANSLEESYKKGVYKVNDNIGINSLMPEFADLFNKGKISIVSNIGTLVEPIAYDSFDTKQKPYFLFAHDHQRRVIATAQGIKPINTGWLGRYADSLGDINGNVGLNISISSSPLLMTGERKNPLSIGNSPINYKDPKGYYKNYLDRVANIENSFIFNNYYQKLQKRAANLSSTLQNAWQNKEDFSTYSAKNSYGKTLFSLPNPKDDLTLDIHSLSQGIFKDFETIARLLKISKDTLSFNRQVFHLRLGGFDFHSAQIEDQTIKLRSLSIALSDFYKALEEMGMDKEVVLFVTNDFGRTLLNNGDGTDHAWGGDTFIMSGATEFNGGAMLGNLVDNLRLDENNKNFVPKAWHKGRLIPTTAWEQMEASIMDWFGANETQIAQMFPNLSNFKTDANDYKSAFLSGVFN